jgi:hypothetical protein
MKGIVIFGLLAVAGFALWKQKLGVSVNASLGTAEQSGFPSGVSEYTTQLAPQSAQQLLAFQQTNQYQVTPAGYAPAFGENENQPGWGESLI